MARRLRFSAVPATFGRSAIRACCLVLALGGTPASAIAEDKLVLQLQREPQFEFAGYYAALWKGFYRDAGLEVEIKPGTAPGATPIDPVREVTEGRARFGTGTVQLLIRTAQGLPLLLLAPIFQQSGTAVYYRADGDFSSPRALLNARVGRLPASNILDLELRAALNSESIDPDKLKSVSIEPGQGIAALADHRVDAVVGSAWELPWQAQERAVALKSFSLGDYRPEFYGDSLFTLQRFAKAEPTTVERFREASIKGWEYALQHPDEISTWITTELPREAPVSNPVGFAHYQSEVARKLARFPEVPLGHSDPNRWSANQQRLMAIGAMSRPVDLETFLYVPQAGFADRRAWLILVAAVGGALLVPAGLLWRRRHRLSALMNAPKRILAMLDQTPPHALVRPALARLHVGALRGLERVRKVARQLAAWGARAWSGPHATDLNTTLMALEPSVRRRVPGRVTCRMLLLPEPCLCHADTDAVTAMTILDLVGEAVADMPEGGELVIGTRQSIIDQSSAAEFPGSAPGDYVRVTVKDSGHGLSADRLERIFYPETTPRPAVAASWELMRRLGGFAAVESAEGIGTAVHLYFVRAHGTGENANEPSAEEIQAQAAE